MNLFVRHIKHSRREDNDINIPTALEERNARSLDAGSKENTPNIGDDELSSEAEAQDAPDSNEKEPGLSKEIQSTSKVVKGGLKSSKGERNELSEYEIEKRRNIEKNAELLRQFEEEYVKRHGATAIPEPPTTTPAKKRKNKKGKSSSQAESRKSTRLTR